jgi:threonine dehydratase
MMNPTPGRLHLHRIRQAHQAIDPVFLHSPQYRNESLGDHLRNRLVLKVETQNPIRSFKGRGCDWLVSQLPGRERLICASAGNFGQALAYACRKKAIPLTVYAGLHANPMKVERMRALGAEVVLYGEDFDAAKEQARAVARQEGIRFVEDSLDVETVEGAGTIGLELLGYPDPIDVLLVPLGNGGLFNGVATVFRALSPATRVVAVGAAGAPAMIESWRQGQFVTHPQAATIADGIAVRLPVPQALLDMQDLATECILVEDQTILLAMKLIHRHAGLVTEPSGAVGIAAVLENPEAFAGQTVATIVCGGNLTDGQVEAWL